MATGVIKLNAKPTKCQTYDALAATTATITTRMTTKGIDSNIFYFKKKKKMPKHIILLTLKIHFCNETIRFSFKIFKDG